MGSTLSGLFHAWGLATVQHEQGMVSHTVGIVELTDGTIIKADPADLKFETHAELFGNWGQVKKNDGGK